MGDQDVINKLARILETHSFGDSVGGSTDGGSDFDSSELGQFINRATSVASNRSASPDAPARTTTKSILETDSVLGDGPMQDSPNRKPFEAWKQKHKHTGLLKEPPKIKTLTETQKDALVDTLFRRTKSKESAIIKDQNTGLKLELTGHEFRPKLNKKSQDLSKSMKPLLERVPGLEKEKQEMLQRRREAKEKDDMKECKFEPTTVSAKESEHYLKRLGRTSAVTPDDFFKFKRFKELRNDQRRKILNDIEAKELTFKPQINASSRELCMKVRGGLNESVDHATRILAKSKDEELIQNLKKGISFTVESEHPYPHNVKKNQPISRIGAVAYTIEFDSLTATEPVYDFIKFYRQDSNEGTWGAEKYSGGIGSTTSNWPGCNGRPALIIPSTKFTIYFQTNATVNGWGYKMIVTPYYANDAVSDDASMSIKSSQMLAEALEKAHVLAGQPMIVSRAKGYKDSEGRSVHDRLYIQGKELLTAKHNANVELISSKLNLELRPWEDKRKMDSSASWTLEKSHLAKNTKTADDYLWNNGRRVTSEHSPPVCLVDYDDSVISVWKFLQNNILLHAVNDVTDQQQHDGV